MLTYTTSRYAQALWWSIHHSNEPDRLGTLLYSYLDESGVDGNLSPIAVVAGLTLQSDRFTWLDIDWQKAIEKHDFGRPYVHMKDFGQHGPLRDLSEAKRLDLFTDLSKAIREYKTFSIEATLTTEHYKLHFSRFANTSRAMHSIHAACFLLMAIFQGKQANQDGYEHDIPFILDDGAAHKMDIVNAHEFLVNEFQKRSPAHIGPLSFADDEKVCALQAADVIAWVVRRKRTGLSFRNGFEPLENVLEGQHLDQHFQQDWMIELTGFLDRMES